MDLNYFKDKLFDILNETDEMEICNISVDDRNNLFTIILDDGSVFKMLCRKSPE